MAWFVIGVGRCDDTDSFRTWQFVTISRRRLKRDQRVHFGWTVKERLTVSKKSALWLILCHDDAPPACRGIFEGDYLPDYKAVLLCVVGHKMKKAREIERSLRPGLSGL